MPMTHSSSSFAPARLRATAVLAALVLAACGDGAPVPDTAQPVLVVRPGDLANDGVGAYAGEIRAREESPLSFQVGGRLVRRLVDAGEHVTRGQVLAEIDPGDLRLQAQSAQAQLASAEAEYARARTDRARYATLVDEQLVSRSQMDQQDAAYKAAEAQVRAARAQTDVARNQAGYTQLRAPRDGVIANRQAEAGEVVAAGQPIFTLAGDAGREVAIALPESRIAGFRVGQTARVELWNRPGTQFEGRISEIAAAADPQARTYAARVALDLPGDAAVELGQSARVYLAGDGAEPMSLPLSAIQPGADGGKSVWVVDPQRRAVVATPVSVGAYGARTVPVREGLTADALVVAAGGHLLRDGQVVTPVDRDNRPVPLAPLSDTATTP
ncbi:efflux RND transporter periplasmic adaptor subunit [Luteimonas rhizosphaerae]|uniref:efflux RND transporter periplasmic adaptor subunit n=1 Tax=Luteimonas sp. 4-12 TaxID=2027406 RepID=UPI001E54AC84|nr:efflux RND transporter periplasmic adaptor subunit [Luteimonas sp. 4-12]